MPVNEKNQNMFTMVTREGLFPARGVPEEVLNTTPHFQSVMDTEVLAKSLGVILRVCVNETIAWPRISTRFCERKTPPTYDRDVLGWTLSRIIVSSGWLSIESVRFSSKYLGVSRVVAYRIVVASGFRDIFKRSSESFFFLAVFSTTKSTFRAIFIRAYQIFRQKCTLI